MTNSDHFSEACEHKVCGYFTMIVFGQNENMNLLFVFLLRTEMMQTEVIKYNKVMMDGMSKSLAE